MKTQYDLINDTDYDTIITGATVIDGSGSKGVKTDVGIKNEYIVAINNLNKNSSKEVIDGMSMVLSPGFIDVHTHDDFSVFKDPDIAYKAMQGVTTIIVGNCGYSVAPCEPSFEHTILYHDISKLPKWNSFKEYFECINNQPPAINVGVLAGHGTFRYAVMGYSDKSATETQLKEMKDLFQEGLDAGVLGLSTGLSYTPNMYADTREVIHLVKQMKDKGALLTVHMRNEGKDLIEAIEEAIKISEKTGISVEISHFKCFKNGKSGQVKAGLKLIEDANKRGLNINIDQYPYSSGSTSLRGVMGWGGFSSMPNAMADFSASNTLIASSTITEWIGKSVQEIADSWNMSADDAANEMIKTGEIIVVLLNCMNEEDVCTIMKHQLMMVGSDGIPAEKGNPHPRLYSTFAKILGYYVHDKKLLTLESAINKMTTKPAEKFNLRGRGRIEVGAYADLVLFNPETISDKSTYTNPKVYPEGIKDVFVNGKRVVKNGIHTHIKAGHPLKRS